MENQEKWLADLKSPDVRVRAFAAESLCYAGTDSVGAATGLVAACGDDDSVRRWAVAALEDLGPPQSDSRERLDALVTSPNALVAYWAATLLGRLGVSAVASQSILAGVLLNSEDVSVKERSAWALGKLGATTDIAVSALKQAVDSGNSRLARLALAALPPVQELNGLD